MRTVTLTWYTGNNFGSTLQAYALQRTVCELGHTNEILAYHPPKLENLKLKLQNHSLQATMNYKLNEFYLKLAAKGNQETQSNMALFDEFRSQHLKFSAPCSTKAELESIAKQYDKFLCGSDQIWNPYYFDPVYFLSFVHDPDQKVPYAPSLGVTQIPEFARERLAKQLRTFSRLSVREQQGAELIQQLTGLQAKTVADPTLLLKADDWRKLSKPLQDKTAEPYVFCYFLRNNPTYHEVVQKIAQRHGLTVQTVPMVIGDFDRPGTIHDPVGPAQWLDLLDNAAYVVTDSFHCTIFSILFQKNFGTFHGFSSDNQRSQNSRIDNILRITGLEDQLLPLTAEDIHPVSEQQWMQANAALEPWIDESRQWLADGINGNQ